MDALDNVKIAKPCSASWDAMDGDERKRFCQACKLHVYNVAEMDRAEALALLEAEGKVCLRLYRRADGTVITRDCPIGSRISDGRWRVAGFLTIGACLWGLNILDNGLQHVQGGRLAYADKMAALIEPGIDRLANWIETSKATLNQTRSSKLDAVASQPTTGSN